VRPLARIIVLALALVATTFESAGAFVAACELTVRDAAFRTRRDTHSLCVIADADDEAGQIIHDDLLAWLYGAGHDLNLKLVKIQADDPDVRWNEYGLPSAPPSMPVVALVGQNAGAGRSFVIDHWEPSPSADDLAALKSSPVRQQLSQELGQHVAMILFSPALDYDDGAAREVLEKTVEKWSGTDRPGVSVIQLDRSDPRERILSSFCGLDPQGPHWVGVVFGRGKLMFPPLQAAEISFKKLDEVILQVDQDCSCSKPLPSMGVDIPLVWNEKLTAKFIPTSDPAEESEDARDDTELVLPSLASDDRSPEESPSDDKAIETPVESDTPVETVASGTSLVTMSFISVAAILVAAIVGSIAVLRRS